jgi:hypothetical protein
MATEIQTPLTFDSFIKLMEHIKESGGLSSNDLSVAVEKLREEQEDTNDNRPQ